MFKEMMFVIIGGVMVMLIIAGLLRQKPETVFEASFASPCEAASRWNRSFSVGSSALYVSTEMGYKNIFICGKSGSGKGVNYVTNSIFNILGRTSASMIVVDPGGENFKITSGYAQQKRKVYSVDFSDPGSYGFNPFSVATESNELEQTVHVLFANSGSAPAGDPFWFLSSEHFTAFWCKVLMTQEPRYRTFANVLRLIDQFATCPAETTDRLIVKTTADLISQYKTFVATPPNTMQGIIAQARASLKIFGNPSVMTTTSMEQSLNIDAIRREPHIVYLTTPIPKLEYLRPVIAVFIQSLYDRFLSRLPSKDDLPVYMVLDEASSYKINNFSVYMSNARKYLMPTLIAVQEKSSLESRYKSEAKNIISNCFTQCYLPGTTELNTLREVTQLLGEHWRVDETTEKRLRQPLLSVPELTRLEDKAVVFIGSNPMLITLKPYYRHWQYSRYAALPTHKAQTTFSGDIPLITFD